LMYERLITYWSDYQVYYINTIKNSILTLIYYHYHISLQSECDDTLRRMNRKHTTGQYRNVVESLRLNIPHVVITINVRLHKAYEDHVFGEILP
jgi:tRNA A37 methylthiotransferase MiaB